MTDNELMIVESEPYLGKPIDRDLVVEFGDTLMGVHPGAKEVGVQGMRTVAQLALITGANPLPGTNGIHAWRDNKGNVQVQFGVGFWRSQAEIEGGVLWIDRPRPMTDSERQYYGITELQTASICSAALKRAVFDLMREVKEFGIDMTVKDAKNEVARVGVGIVNPNEYAKAGRPMQWTSDLRAERDLYRQLVPVMHRARDRAMRGEIVEGGQGWRRGDFAHSRDPRLQAPDDYSSDDANADLFADDPRQSEWRVGSGDDLFDVTIDDEGDIIDITPEPNILVDSVVEYDAEPEDEPELLPDDEHDTAPEAGNGKKQEPAPPTPKLLKDNETLRRKFHATGKQTYGDEWDDQRAKWSKLFEVESSNDFTIDQTNRLIDGMTKKLAEKQAEQEPLVPSTEAGGGAYSEQS